MDRASYPGDLTDNMYTLKMYSKLFRAEQFKHITEVKRVRK